MIRYVVIVMFICFAFAKANSSPFQSYKRHIVKQGDTMYKLTSTYNVTAAQLLDLNPDLKLGLKTGATILIPKSQAEITARPIVSYKEHKVRRKETLYTLAREYGVTEIDIKEANKELYAEPLQRGSRIKIPVFKDVETVRLPDQSMEIKVIPGVTDIKKVVPEAAQERLTYTVKKSEGKYRVALNNNITTEQLEQYNPGLGELKEGMIVYVSAPAVTTGSEVGVKYIDYEVEPKMTMYRLEKMTGLTADSLRKINPALKEGVKKGMVIKVPYKAIGEKVPPAMWNSTATYARLVDSISNYNEQRIAVMLPFSISDVTEEAYKEKLQSSSTIRIATDFYSGMMIARDSARALGINVYYDVYDTQKDEQTSLRIINSNDFTRYNSVIGPLVAKNVVAVARELKEEDIPVVSPLTTTSVKLYKNLFQARPDKEFLMNRLKNYLINFAQGKNVIIITDNEKPAYKAEFAALFPNARILFPNDENYISNAKYNSVLSKDQENVVIMAVDSKKFFTGAIPNYAAMSRKYKITVVGMDDYDDMGLNNRSLAAVRYTYPKMNRNTSSENIFSTHYFQKHGITPSEFATRGFDVAMDVILRQASASDLYESAVRNGKTVMVENSFEYNKRFLAGFYNEACYILRFQPDLSVIEISQNGEQ